MRENIEERVLEVAAYIIEHDATVRSAAIVFDVSKSTVHSDMTKRLPRIDGSTYKKVKVILDRNREERHIRGGEMTRQKYSKMRG
ncbi:MAG: sporulation transcriptional regulator SpoIIID [Clostridia bacterium]|nr:sporulation transcriptional regulator SpoIIID [Clostridia bacterium]